MVIEAMVGAREMGLGLGSVPRGYSLCLGYCESPFLFSNNFSTLSLTNI